MATKRQRIAAIRRRIDETFFRNEYGLWCPNCQEAIDESWPESCDYCGYPKSDCEDFDRDDDYFD